MKKLKFTKEYKDKLRWRVIILKGENTKYSISSHGDVRNNKNGKIIKPSIANGYYRVCLTHNGERYYKSIHRLVLMAFDYNDKHKELQINHKSGFKDNNYWSNLEWSTSLENIKHSWDTGLRKIKYTDEMVHSLCSSIEQGLTLNIIARIYSVPLSLLEDILYRNKFKNISKNYNIKPKSGKKKYNDKDIIRVCELLELDKDVSTISKATGVSIALIHDIRNGNRRKEISKNYSFVRTVKISYSNEIIHQVCKLIDDDLSNSDIAKITGVFKDTISNVKRGKTRKEISCNYNFYKSLMF